MKKNIGSVVGLYPTPVTIVGTEINGKVNWMNVAHIGIIGFDKMLLSMGKIHYTNKGLITNRTVSINIVNDKLLIEADYVGLVSGKNIDKSKIFEYFTGELKGAPLIKKSPISMECEIVDMFETEMHHNFIVRPVNTYVDEEMLSKNERIDFEKVSPVLFEISNKRYLSTGNVIAKCWDIGKKYKKGDE